MLCVGGRPKTASDALYFPRFALSLPPQKAKIAVNLIIDIGNTVAKIALFEGASLVDVFYDSNQTLEQLPDICRRRPVERAIVATVIDLTAEVEARLAALPCPLLRLGPDTPLPVENLYETPCTLGYDRMAAVVGASDRFPAGTSW